jgi:hypothetical protein
MSPVLPKTSKWELAMEDRLKRYIDARKQVKTAEGSVQVVVDRITKIAEKLRNWQNVSVHGIGLKAGESQLSLGAVIEARDWPTAEQLHEALTAWREAKNEQKGAHQALSSDERDSVQPPL